MRKRTIRFVLILLSTSFGTGFFCQENKPLTLQKIGKEYGISDSYIADILQDKRGVYWMTGLNGLIMFDGQKSGHFKLPFYKNKTLASNILSSLFFENDSTLWVANSQGVCRFDVYQHIFSPIPIEKEYASQTLNFSIILRDQNGTIWLSTRELGLMVYDENKQCIRKTDNSTLSELNRVRNILKPDKELLLICHAKGQLLFNIKTGKAKDSLVKKEWNYLTNITYEGTVSDTYLDKNYSYSTVRKKGEPFYSVFVYDKISKKSNALTVKSSFGFKFFKDSKENIWMYNDGIYLIEKKSNRLFSITMGNSSPFSQCYKIFEDSYKNVWFCTNNGLYVLNPDKLILENKSEIENGVYKKHIYTCITEFGNEIWLGTYGEGIIICDSAGNCKKNINLSKLSGNENQNNTGVIYASNKTNEIWVGSILGSIARYDAGTKSFKFYNDTLFHQQRVAAICEDVKGSVYFGTISGRIISYDVKNNTFKLVYNELSQKKDAIDFISGMIFSDENTLYVSTSFNGFYQLKLNTGSIKTYKLDPENSNSIKSNDLYYLESFGKKGFYMGSTNGLIHFDPEREKFDSFSPEDGLPFTEIYNLRPFEDDELIANTSDGIYKINFNKKNFVKIGRDSPVESINFSSIYYQSKNKIIFLCSDDYFYRLEYEKSASYYPPKSFIYSLKTNDSTFNFSKNLPKKLDLKRNQNSFSILFGSPGYKHNDRLSYQYRIDELEDSWLNASSAGEARFNNLKGGVYTFRIKMIDKETKNKIEELSLTIEIKKAFYETIWFYALMILLALSILYTIYRLRLNKLLAVERVRLKLARDLHDDIGSSLSTINILSSMAEKKVNSDPQTTKIYLGKISNNSQDIMENMGDIVWSINPANDSIEKVVSKMREFANTILEPKNIKFEFHVKEEISNVNLKMEYRRDLFLIYKEAINNAAKYSNCSKIRVDLQIINKVLTFQIADNGKGFDTTSIKAGNGLSNMERRARSIHANFHCRSVIGEGTTIQLEIPVSAIT